MKLFKVSNKWHLLRAAAGWPALIAGIYMLAALIGSVVPANNGWKEPETGIPIYVETNGIHVSLIVPVNAAGENLGDYIRPEHLSDMRQYGTHFMIGWGHKPVYRNAQTWSDVSSGDIVSAIFGSSETTLHIYHLIDPQPAPHRKIFKVRPAEYRAIIRQIRATFQMGADGRTLATPAYGPNNLFYDANGHYSAVNTCNNWTGTILRHAGVKVGIWTPMADGIMRRF